MTKRINKTHSLRDVEEVPDWRPWDGKSMPRTKCGRWLYSSTVDTAMGGKTYKVCGFFDTRLTVVAPEEATCKSCCKMPIV